MSANLQKTILLLIIVIEFFQISQSSEGCYKAFTVDKNGLSFTVGGDSYETLTGVSVSGETVTVKCDNEYETFTNEVKLIPGVSSYTIYSTGGFTTKCTNKGIWSPNIEAAHNLDGSLTNTDMTYMCAVGCPLIQSRTHKITYGGGMLSHERYSPPVLPSRDSSPEYAQISCRDGYTVAVGNNGYTETYCTTNGEWSRSSISAYIKCVKGCSDITDSITWATTQALPSEESGEPPFGPGDVVSYTCEEGFILVGTTSLTCKGDTVWSDDLPSCVYVDNSRKKRSLQSNSSYRSFVTVLPFLVCMTFIV